MTTTLEIIQNELASNDFTKKIVYGIAGASVISAAFFIGYQAAKRHHSKHLLHIRDTDKNDQVRRIFR